MWCVKGGIKLMFVKKRLSKIDEEPYKSNVEQNKVTDSHSNWPR
jgi:hypothetical protein